MALTSPGLIKAANDALVGVSADINIVTDFAVDFSADFADYGTTVKVPVAKATASAFNATSNNYETDTGTVTYVNIALTNHPKATMKAPAATAFEAPNAPYWAKVKTALVNAIGGSISSGLGALFTTTACTGTGAELGAVTAANVAALRANCLGKVGSTVLALGPVQFATLLGCLDSATYGGAEAVRTGKIAGLYGFKSVICLRDLPDGVLGALIPMDAVAVAARGTIKDATPFLEAETVADENGFPISVARHFSFAQRDEFLNADLLWGASIVQGDKIALISAASSSSSTEPSTPEEPSTPGES